MPTLLDGKGYLSLSESDTNIGSFFSLDDICEILEIDDVKKACFLSALDNVGLVKNGFVDEKKLYPMWKGLKKMFSSIQPLHYTSFDEYVLLAIFRRTFPNAHIEQQVKIGTKYVDFKISNNGETKYIEFDGPSHFISQKSLEDPFIRIQEIQKQTGCELVRWPFWIQRCATNAKILFNRNAHGYGALWSSTKYFGDFTISTPSSTIKALTQRFNAERSTGIGYFYEEDSSRKKPTHPIIRKIQKDPSKIKLLIPKDAEDLKYWVPQDLWNLVD